MEGLSGCPTHPPSVLMVWTPSAPALVKFKCEGGAFQPPACQLWPPGSDLNSFDVTMPFHRDPSVRFCDNINNTSLRRTPINQHVRQHKTHFTLDICSESHNFTFVTFRRIVWRFGEKHLGLFGFLAESYMRGLIAHMFVQSITNLS